MAEEETVKKGFFFYTCKVKGHQNNSTYEIDPCDDPECETCMGWKATIALHQEFEERLMGLKPFPPIAKEQPWDHLKLAKVSFGASGTGIAYADNRVETPTVLYQFYPGYYSPEKAYFEPPLEGATFIRWARGMDL